MGKLHLLRDLNIRIFLNSDNKTNFTNLHILASLGIDCGIWFGENNIDWESLNDLMTYAIYGKVNHASIEPFQFIANNYSSARFTDYSSVYFENPYNYLHIDKDENIALSYKDLKNKNYVNTGFDTLPNIFENDNFKEAMLAWQQFFLKTEGCAYCQAWRVCMGKFCESIEKNPGCQQFFSDMMDAADHFLSVQHKNKRKEVWQP